METSFFFKNMLPKEEEELKEYLSRKINKIEKMLVRMPPDGVVLHVKGEKFTKHSAYKIELLLDKLGERFSSAEDSHTLTKAVDLSLDRIIAQMKKKAQQNITRMHRPLKKLRTGAKRGVAMPS